jgi:hypothetical protein
MWDLPPLYVGCETPTVELTVESVPLLSSEMVAAIEIVAVQSRGREGRKLPPVRSGNVRGMDEGRTNLDVRSFESFTIAGAPYLPAVGRYGVVDLALVLAPEVSS